VSVPWTRPGSGFTLLFEALVLSFAAAMPMAKVAEMTRKHDTRIRRVVEHHGHAARDQLDYSGVTRVGMDETSAAKGQDYISIFAIFADLECRRVIFATEGRSAETAPVSPLIWPSTGRSGEGHRHQLRHEHRIHLRNHGAPAERDHDLRPLPPGRQAQRGS
jgi:Helix-turn-helix domain of transposase family ISL3